MDGIAYETPKRFNILIPEIFYLVVKRVLLVEHTKIS